MARVHAVIGEETPANETEEEAVYEEAEDTTLIAGTVSISGKPAYILIDTGASHSFISSSFVESQGLVSTRRPHALGVKTPLGKYVKVNRICRNQEVQLAVRTLQADLTVLDMRDFDAILGMDWLTAHSAVVNCKKRSVEFGRGKSEPIVFRGRKLGASMTQISALQTKHLIAAGCEYFLVSIVDTDAQTPEISSVPVVSEFADVFPEDLPGLPPERDVEFCIELQPGTTPVARALHRMAPAELK